MNLKEISTQLLYTTVPIRVQRTDGTEVGGTGFYYSVPLMSHPDRQVPFVVTNFHVVQGARSAVLEFVEREKDLPKLGSAIRAAVPAEALGLHVSERLDIAAIPIGGFLSQMESSGKPVFMRSIAPSLIPSPDQWDNFGAIEEVTFIGYPSGLYDSKNFVPLARRGVTASPPGVDFQGDPAFLVDAEVFPGSSGSPVFILNQGAYAVPNGLALGNRLFFMGVLGQAVIRTEAVDRSAYMGLGRVTKSPPIREFLEAVMSTLPLVDQPAKVD